MMNQSFIRVLVYSDKKVFEANFHEMGNITERGYEVFGYIFHTFCEKCHEGKPIKNVTHWMYLPKKPKTDSAILKQ